MNKKDMLGTEPIGKLLPKFAIPSIIAMLVSALYNMVDQIFIGNYVGELGNAATNIAFPLSTMCIATSLLFGIGGAASFNLNMGAGKKEEAGYYIGNSFSCMLIGGVILAAITELFMSPLLMFFGSPEDVLPFAISYTKITALGFPLLISSTGGAHLIRSDGKPTVAMACNLVGAVTNTVLDTLFVVVFKWGMEGAALATVIGQGFAAILVIWHISHFKTVKLGINHFIPKAKYFLHAANLGMSQGCNQIAMMVVQIVLNNSLKYYGARSVYGESIPIAVVGVVSKVNMLYFSGCIGISQGLQPIASFNYGAKNYKRTREAYLKAISAGTIISVVFFLLFQLFPKQIISIFGKGSEEYVDFAVRYFRVYLFCTFINNVQPFTSSFFSAIGKPVLGMFMSLTRQIIFLLPLVVIFPLFWGIDGIMYAGPIADALAFSVAMAVIIREFARREYKTEQSGL